MGRRTRRRSRRLSYAAKVRYDTVVDGRLQEPARLSPALLERLTEPLAGLYRDLADRLVATGEIDLGMATRRTLIQLLREPSGRLGDHSRVQLASAYADLARDLQASGRLLEAEAARAEATAVLPHGQPADEDHGGAVLSRGAPIPAWAPLSPAAAYTASTASTKIVDLVALQAEQQGKTAAWLDAERPSARQHELRLMDQARVDAEYREAEHAKAEQAEAARLAAERARAAEEQRLKPPHGPPPRRPSGWSVSAVVRSASKRTVWRRKSERPSSGKLSGWRRNALSWNAYRLRSTSSSALTSRRTSNDRAVTHEPVSPRPTVGLSEGGPDEHAKDLPSGR